MAKVVIVSLFFFFAGLYFINEGYHEHSRFSKLEKLGINVMSEPLEGYTENKRNGTTEDYSIYPIFKDDKGNTYKCSGQVDKPIIDSMQENPVIEIRYLADDPYTCQIKGADTRGTWMEFGLGMVMTLVSSVFLFNALSIFLRKH